MDYKKLLKWTWFGSSFSEFGEWKKTGDRISDEF